MPKPRYCMEALRKLASDTSLDPGMRFIQGERTIKDYISQAGKSMIERLRMLDAISPSTASIPAAGDFWPTMRDFILSSAMRCSTSNSSSRLS
jgi:hypothetical protein